MNDYNELKAGLNQRTIRNYFSNNPILDYYLIITDVKDSRTI